MPFYGKLVRDLIPSRLDEKGIGYTARKLDDNRAFKLALISKVMEEAEEFLEDNSEEEFADLLEVIEALKEFYPNHESTRMAKRVTHGAFMSRVFLVETE